MDTATPAPASAQPASDPQTQSAAHAAVSAGDTAAYRVARRAERVGKPLADVPIAAATPAEPPTPAPAQDDPAPAAPEPASAQPGERTVSKRQQQINDYERRIAELEQRIARAEAPPARTTPEPAAAASAPPKAKFPSIAEWSTQPGNEGKSLEDYLEARDDFRDEQRRQASQSETQRAERDQANQQQADRFKERLQTAIAADPQWSEKVHVAYRKATPLSGCTQTDRGEYVDPNRLDAQGQPTPVTFTNAVADVAFFSEHPLALFTYLSAHEDVADRLSRLPAQHCLRELYVLDGRLTGTPAAEQLAVEPAEPAAPAPKVITDAPAARQPIGRRASEATDPKAAAVKSGDTRAYREIRRQERAAAMGR